MTTDKYSINAAKKATRSIFLVCGLALSSWAPMVPFAKDRLQLNDSGLGLLLLLLGGGAITMMPVSGYFSHKYGTRIVILLSGITAALCLPLLLLISNVYVMGVALFVFGASIGTIDVAMNAHGIQVENKLEKPIMSSLHGLFSVGGLCGSLGLGFLIEAGLQPIPAATVIAGLLLVILVWKYKSLFSREQEDSGHTEETSGEKKKGFAWLRASVIFLGASCFVVFLSEGAMLDWSALFLKENRGVSPALSGIGYAAFSIAMATMRLAGDGIVSRLSGQKVVVGGGIIAAAGIFLAVSTPYLVPTLLGFILLGIGAANIVPVFFSEAGRLKGMPSAIAITAVSTMGYAGQLAGPALLGFIAHEFSLTYAIALIGILLLVVALAYAFRKKPI